MLTLSIPGRCRSRISLLSRDLCFSSFRLPITVVWLSSQRQIGIGAPQNRLRLIPQSLASANQLPKRPCLMCFGIHSIFSLFLTRSSTIEDTFTNQLGVAK